MSNINGISAVHVKKLSHNIEEIRSRALDNIISKYDLGFCCDCDAVKRELITKLFNWFSFETFPQAEKVLNLLLRLSKTGDRSYLNAFGKLRFQNELHELRRKLSSEWYEILNEIEEIIVNPDKSRVTTVTNTESTKNPNSLRMGFIDYDRHRTRIKDTKDNRNNTHRIEDYNLSHNTLNLPSSLDSSVPFDLTLEYGEGTPISKTTEGSIKWLVMPWQPLVTSDKCVLAAVEEALNNSLDINLILHTCQFITNVMMQDFPAEVFLQRPVIVSILHNLLESSASTLDVNLRSVIPMILKTLYKLTRSLRLRIYYYCEPCIANKIQKALAGKLSSNFYSSSEARASPDGGFAEVNYQTYQSTATSERSQSVTDNIDDSILQLQQMLIPIFCIDSLRHVLAQLTLPLNSTFPLRNIKYITDLAYELVQLLLTSVMPNVWLCNDDISLKVIEDMKVLFNILGDIIEYFANYNTIDHFRITYLHLITITMKLLSNIVPLEIANTVFPKSLKISICIAIMDAPIYLLYPRLHSVLQEYGRQFQSNDEIAHMKMFDETKMIIKSMQAAISVIKNSSDLSPSDLLRTLYASKLSLSYHKNFTIIKKTIKFLQNINRYSLNNEDYTLGTKLILSLLASGDSDIQYATYLECHMLVKNILGVEYSRDRLSWENLIYLLESSVLTEIISHGITNDDKRIKEMSDEILVYILKGRVHMGENGWLRSLEAVTPVLPLLQCHANPSTPLGQCMAKIFDPDVSTNIQLPYVEVLKGNLRFLFSPNDDIREEAICRLIWLLGKEKDSVQKLPRLSSLLGLPLGSLCILEHKTFLKKSEGNYQKRNLSSVLEMLKEPNIDPKMRKSALVQISVMLSDSSLHKTFITEKGLPLILQIFNSALVGNDYINYPDSVIPIMTILKLLASTETSIRHDLSTRINVLSNIIRSIFLFPNNESIKIDGSQLLCLLLYDEYIVKLNEKYAENNNHLHISLPHIIVTKMKLPFVCKSHWKISMHRRSDISVLHGANPLALTFVKQYWIWEWNDGLNVLWKNWNSLSNVEMSEKLEIQENEFLILRFSFPHYCCQQQLCNIQTSTTHDAVSCALDYLTMYMKFYKLQQYEGIEDISLLPWKETFERFLHSHPTSKDDCDLFVEVLNFLQLYVNITKNGKNTWTGKIMENITRLLAELFKNMEIDNQNVYQSILKLARTCAAIEKSEKPINEEQDVWLHFIELIVSTLCFGDQQHFYNLACLDWLLACLTYLIRKCDWASYRNLLVSLGNTLIELIISFHGAGTESFMGLSITRNSIICLNHLLYQMQINFNKSILTAFWYEEGRTLTWLPMLWQNRDPLVRASGLELLAGLVNNLHTASQLLNSIALIPSELCQALLQYITNREESCIVREQACIAFSNIVKNCNSVTFQYVDSLKANAILIYIEQSNIYYEITVLCSNIYVYNTLDDDEINGQVQENEKAPSIHSLRSNSTSLVPRTVSYLYNCQDELQNLSLRGSSGNTDMDNYLQLIATPSLIIAVCRLLNNLILTGKQEIVHQIYEHSIDKYLFGCINYIPKDIESQKNLTHYCDILEMYISICSVLTNCVTYSNEYISVINFTPDSLNTLLCFLNGNLYCTEAPQLTALRDRMWTAIFNFIAILSLTENQHFESIQTALELSDPKMVLTSICVAIKSSQSDLRMSAIGCLAFLLSQEIQKDTLGKSSVSLQAIIDTTLIRTSSDSRNNLREAISNINKLSLQIANVHSRKSNEDDDIFIIYEKATDHDAENEVVLGEELSGTLLYLFIAHNYNRSKKNRKLTEDKYLITSALTNLLCVSIRAKEVALEQNLPDTIVMVLKEFYVRFNLQPFELYKNQANRDAKMHPLVHDVNSIFILLMNFMYGNTQVKEVLTKSGLADVLHKLWAWVALNKTVSTTALKLLATYTTKCPTAAQSLTLTTTLPGTGLRKTPNTLALIHVIVQLVCKEIDKAGQHFDNHKLHFAFHILRNAVHVHECRVSISKSNLLQFFTKIHPITTKRIKPWPLVELYCLEFLIDFTYYEEGQLCVPKAVDGFDVLLHLSKCSSSSSRILAISILRNLAFNITNRPRLLSSVDFINVLHDIFKAGSLNEIKIAGSMLWSLIANNQKGKLVARSAGFSQSIQEALGRLTLLTIDDKKQEQDLVKMLQYVIRILCPGENKSE